MKYLLLLSFLVTCGKTALENYELGKHFSAEGNYIEAQKYFTRAIKQDTVYINAYLGRASVAFIQDSFALAIHDYTKLIHLQPFKNNAELIYTRGAVYYQSLQDSLACKDFYNACENYGFTKACTAYRKICKK